MQLLFSIVFLSSHPCCFRVFYHFYEISYVDRGLFITLHSFDDYFSYNLERIALRGQELEGFVSNSFNFTEQAW